MKMMTACVVAACAGLAGAAPFTVSEYNGPLVDAFGAFDSQQRSPVGDAFFAAPGIGGVGGFAIAMSGGVDAVFGTTSVIGLDIGTNGAIESSSMVVDNGGNSRTLTISVASATGADLAPAGFNVGGATANTAGFFMGANAGANPLDLGDPTVTTSASIGLRDASGAALADFDISSFGNFSALNGGWDGSVGVTFGAGTTGLGIAGYVLTVNYDVVPAPGAMAVVGLGGLVAARRRR